MGPGPANPGPGLPQVNAFCGHQGQEAAPAFTDRGLELWETEVAGVTVPSRVGSTDFRVEASRAKIATSGQGGLCEPKQDS